MITDLALPHPFFVFEASTGDFGSRLQRQNVPQANPRMPAPPTRKNSRRLKPSHVLPDSPGMDIIIILFYYRLNKKRRTVQQCPRQVLRRLQAIRAS